MFQSAMKDFALHNIKVHSIFILALKELKFSCGPVLPTCCSMVGRRKHLNMGSSLISLEKGSCLAYFFCLFLLGGPHDESILSNFELVVLS